MIFSFHDGMPGAGIKGRYHKLEGNTRETETHTERKPD
jgi:hypothetical protein